MTERKIPKVLTFGPAIMDTLLAATKPPGLTITFPSLHLALKFRRRIYELRTAMEREKHPDFPISLSVRISIDTWNGVSGQWHVWGKNPHLDKNAQTRVRLWPADSEFTDILRHAGVRPRSSDEGAFDNLLSSLKGDKQ